ncbi:hypothetical protein K4G95_24225, partial [Mycobacterium tuberculosis]|nr:hypothetical protein [Mycobacterium tuberculosis]
MKKLSLTLRIEGKKKRFRAPKFVSSDVLPKSLDLEDNIDKMKNPQIVFQKCYPLICEIFGNQFTPSQLQKGIEVG